MELDAGGCRIRSWRRGDVASLTEHANNPRIARNVRDMFPSPYRTEDAEHWLAVVSCMQPESQFAVDVNGHAVGGIGISPGLDVHRIDGELGYWLGEEFWNRGIMTSAIKAFVPYAFSTFNLERIHANVFEWNVASGRVLEKAGFVLEGRMRRAALKDGIVIDVLLYAMIRPDQDGVSGTQRGLEHERGMRTG